MIYPQNLGIKPEKVVEKLVETDNNEKALTEFLDIYPRKSHDIPNIKPIWTELMNKGVYPSDLNSADLNYAHEKLKLKDDQRHLKLPQNFLTGGYWLRYVPLALKECHVCHGERFIEGIDTACNPVIIECSCVHRYDSLWR